MKVRSLLKVDESQCRKIGPHDYPCIKRKGHTDCHESCRTWTGAIWRWTDEQMAENAKREKYEHNGNSDFRLQGFLNGWQIWGRKERDNPYSDSMPGTSVLLVNPHGYIQETDYCSFSDDIIAVERKMIRKYAEITGDKEWLPHIEKQEKEEQSEEIEELESHIQSLQEELKELKKKKRA